MSKVYTEEGSFYGLGDAIRNKNNSANTYSPPGTVIELVS